METLDDVSCRSCSLKATAERLQKEIDLAISEEADTTEIEKLTNNLDLIQSRLQTHRVEDPIDPSIDLSRVVSPKSTKQVMFAKPPQCLCLHISRSTFHTSGAVYKNTCQVAFPETLDLSPYCTNSDLGVDPDTPISGAQALDSEGQKKYQYRLMSTVVHYGSHNFGHFIAYKRRMGRCGCKTCLTNSANTKMESAQHDWYRVSDENVDTCPVQDVLKANPYMLIYELVEEQPPVLPTPIQPAMATPSTFSHPTFKKSLTSSHITHSTMHKISMNKTVSATIQAATRSGTKLPSPVDLRPNSLYSLQ
jgi:ubiquitin carboxyl-terminal hydrolase 1